MNLLRFFGTRPSHVVCKRQDLRLAIRDEQRVFVVRRQTAVRRDHGPAVVKNADFVVSGVDHRLHGNRHVLLQTRAVAGLAVVRDLGRLVQAGADTMADILAHERIAIALGILLNGVADVGDAVADAGKLDALEKALARDADQAQGLIRALAARERARAVAVEAAVAGADVDADDIALMQDAVAGDAMDDLVIDGDMSCKIVCFL